MLCPKCGTEIIGASCTNCGYQIEKSSPTNQQFSPTPTLTPYQQSRININVSNTQQYNQPSLYPEWFKDGFIMGLILGVISFIIFWLFSWVLGFMLGLVSLILAAKSKKHKWLKDESIRALILAIISVLIFMSIFFNFSSISSICSLVFSFFALKLAIHSKKHQGRIALLSIILTAIIFLGEISFFGFLIYALSRSGF